MQTLPLYRLVAQIIVAHNNCQHNGNQEWSAKWSNLLHQINDLLPSGSGLDSGCKIHVQASSKDKIVIGSSVHFMNDCGMYVGWQDFAVIVTPSFQGIDLSFHRVSPSNDGSWALWALWRDGLYDDFQQVLTSLVQWDESGIRFAPESVEQTVRKDGKS